MPGSRGAMGAASVALGRLAPCSPGVRGVPGCPSLILAAWGGGFDATAEVGAWCLASLESRPGAQLFRCVHGGSGLDLRALDPLPSQDVQRRPALSGGCHVRCHPALSP